MELQGKPLLDNDDIEPSLAHLAAMRDDVLSLQKMQKHEILCTFHGKLPFHSAAAHGALPTMDFFVTSLGMSVDVPDSVGRTPLMHAVQARAAESIVWLHRHGADAGLLDDEGNAAAHWAARMGVVSTFALLANLGIDIEARDKQGLTPLDIAVASCNLEVVEYCVLTRGYSDVIVQGAQAFLQPGANAFWIERCLEARVGCHEIAPGESFVRGPLAGGWQLPLASRHGKMSESVDVRHRQLAILTAIFSLADASVFLALGQGQGAPEIESHRRNMCACVLVCVPAALACLFGATWVSPGCVNVSHLRGLYVAALDHCARITMFEAGRRRCNWWGETWPLMHALAAVGPPRSKYCYATRQCVAVFDHYCKFMRHPIGRDNYRMFLSMLLLSFFICVCLIGVAAIALSEKRYIPLAALTLVYFGVFLAFWLYVLSMHLFQCFLGLTTHELIQMTSHRLPDYFFDARMGEFENPHVGRFARNLLARLCPGWCGYEITSGVHCGDFTLGQSNDGRID